MLADPKIGALDEQQQQQQQQQRRSVPKRATDRRWEIPFSWRGGPVRSWRGRTPELRKHLWLELRCKAGRAPGDYYACESVFTRGGSSTGSSCARTPNHDQNTLGWDIRGSGGGRSLQPTVRALIGRTGLCCARYQALILAEWRFIEVPPYLRVQVQTWPQCTGIYRGAGRWALKGAVRRIWEGILFCIILNKLNKQTDLKGKHNFQTGNCFISGGPCHLSSFDQCSVASIFIWEQLVYPVMGVVLPH